MPELPEVERGRAQAEAVARGRRIARVRCADDRKVFQGVVPATLARRLKGRRVEAVRRKGKYLWFELDRRPWPLFHFGMTGAFVLPGVAPLRLESSPEELDTSWPPRFTKIYLFFDDGAEMVMTNARRFGRISLLDDPPNEPPISRLGFDPLLEMPTPKRFAGLLAARRGVLKGLLLDQTFAAGVGNWIADEVLYQAGLDPRRKIQSLRPEEVRRLHARIGSVIKKAVSVNAEKARFPKRWLFHRRWGKGSKVRTADGLPIRFDTVAGRTTAWVPKVQR